jgi:hypothetical protein
MALQVFVADEEFCNAAKILWKIIPGSRVKMQLYDKPATLKLMMFGY